MTNRNMEHRAAIAADPVETEAKEFAALEDFKSRYVYEVQGVPNNPAVLAAVDKWADVWGNEVLTLVNDESFLDDEVPEQKAAREKLGAAAEELAALLPNARFMTGLVMFEGGAVQLSAY